jgi:hypothetical protein
MTETIISMAKIGEKAAAERLLWRRLLVFGLCAGSWLALGLAMGFLIGAGG